MKKVFVCSPYAGDIESNRKAAIKYCRYEIECGNVPFAPHLFFPQILTESNQEERELGISLGIEMMKACDELHVFGDRISEGMKREIDVWRSMGRREIMTGMS